MKLEKLVLFFLVFLGELILPKFLLAQVIPDQTLGTENSEVNSIDELRDAIEGGAIRGENLFHSFQEFNVGEGASVNFANPEGIANIFSRITGGNISEIFGTLGVDGNANLFLMNPNGIVFSENSAINVNGSFLATTAESIEFNDGESFSATNTSESSLTINSPIGLGFSSNSGSITVNGTGNQIASTISFFTPTPVEERVKSSSSLSLQPGNTLALIGNGIDFNSARLDANNGRIEIASVSSGLVNLQSEENGFSFNYDDVTNYQNITLDNLFVTKWSRGKYYYQYS
jgi:filamentous hemagglutinin family protein